MANEPLGPASYIHLLQKSSLALGPDRYYAQVLIRIAWQNPKRRHSGALEEPY